MSELNPHTIFVIKHRAIGDAVMGLSTIQYLKKLFPKSYLIYAVPAHIAPLFSQVKIQADQIYPIELKSPLHWIKHYFKIKKINPSIIFEMFQSGRTQNFFKLFDKIYFFHNHHFPQGLVHDQGVIKPNIQRDLDGAWTYFARDQNLPLPSYLNFCPDIKNSLKRENLITLGIVSLRETKVWPLSYFARLCQLINSDFPEMKIQIPLSPAPQDQKAKETLLKFDLPKNVSFLEVPLAELPLKLAPSQFYVGNDTGLKHLCVALKIKTWTLFGPEPPLEWHPYCSTKHPYFYREELECRTLKSHFCGLSSCETMDCLKYFSPESVWSEIKASL